MKKVSLMIAALALVLGLSQCKKQEEPVANGQKQHIVLTADNGNDGSKVSADFVSANLNLTWDGDEVITVSGGATGTLDKITVDKSNPSKATFEGDIEITDESELFVFTMGETPNYEGQSGTEDGCEEWIHDNISLTGTDVYNLKGQYSVSMKLPYAVLKLDLSAFASDAKDGGVTVTIKSGTTELASVEGITADSKAVYVALPVVAGSTKYTLVGNGKIAEKTWELAANTFFTAADEQGHSTGQAFVIETVTYHETVSFYGTPGIEWSVCNLGATNGETAASWCGSYHKYRYDKVDPANSAWGEDWRLPTYYEWKDLCNNNTYRWLNANAKDDATGFTAPPVNGLLVVKGGKNNNTLDNSVYMFLPLSGVMGSAVQSQGALAYYWSSTKYDASNTYALFLHKSKGLVSYGSYKDYSAGYSVRPVRNVSR